MNPKRWWAFTWWKAAALFALYIAARLLNAYANHDPLSRLQNDESIDLLWKLACFVWVAIYVVHGLRKRIRESRDRTRAERVAQANIVKDTPIAIEEALRKNLLN